MLRLWTRQKSRRRVIKAVVPSHVLRRWQIVLFVALALLWWHLRPTANSWNVRDVDWFYRHKQAELAAIDCVSSTGDSRLDSRCWPALWLRLISTRLQSAGFSLDDSISLPFGWQMMVDYQALTKGEGAESVIGGSSGRASKGPEDGVNTMQKALATENEASRVAIEFLKDMEIPHRVVLLGVGPRGGAVVAPAFQVDGEEEMKFTIKEIGKGPKLSIEHDLEVLQNSWLLLDAATSFANGLLVKTDKWRVETGERRRDAHRRDFVIGERSLLQYFADVFDDRWHPSASLDHLLHDNVVPTMGNEAKYFHETQIADKKGGAHFDHRFFSKLQFSDYEKLSILQHLTRAWLRFTRQTAITSWLAHGSLLGWFWNGLNLPWDQDLDVQMPMSSLFHLARNYNQTIVVDYDGGEAHCYFIDVSPYFYSRSHGDGFNVIDARFVDIRSGMYVDITGLAITDLTEAQRAESDRIRTELHQIPDANYKEVLKLALPEHEKQNYHEKLHQQELTLWQLGNLYNCKTPHFYKHDEIFPLMETKFEGEQAFVPRRFELILRREYPKGMSLTEFGDWIFRPFLGLWLRKSTCKGDRYGSSCEEPEAILLEKFTRAYRLRKGGVERMPQGDFVESALFHWPSTSIMQRNMDLSRGMRRPL